MQARPEENGHRCAVRPRELHSTTEHPLFTVNDGCLELRAWASELEEAFQGIQPSPLKAWGSCVLKVTSRLVS